MHACKVHRQYNHKEECSGGEGWEDSCGTASIFSEKQMLRGMEEQSAETAVEKW